MATVFDQVNTLCPFYISEDCKRISCEGVCKGSTVRLLFTAGKKKQQYKQKYCNMDYVSCPICKMLYKKYEKNNEG